MVRPSVAALLTQLAVSIVLGVVALPQAFSPRVDPNAILSGSPQPIALLWLALAILDLIWIVVLSPPLARLLAEHLATLERQIAASSEERQSRLPRPSRLAALLLITFDVGLADATIRQPLVAVLGALSPPSTVDAAISVVALALLVVLLIWLFVVLRPLVETTTWRILDLFLATTGSQSTRTFFDEPTRLATSTSLAESYRSTSFRRPTSRPERPLVEPTIVAGRSEDQPTILAGRPEDQPTVVGNLPPDQQTIVPSHPEDQPTIVGDIPRDQPKVVGGIPPTSAASDADQPTIVPPPSDSPTIVPERRDESPRVAPSPPPSRPEAETIAPRRPSRQSEPEPAEATVAPPIVPSRAAAVRIVERQLDETDPFATRAGLSDDDTDPFLKQRSRPGRPDETQPELLSPSEPTEKR